MNNSKVQNCCFVHLRVRILQSDLVALLDFPN